MKCQYRKEQAKQADNHRSGYPGSFHPDFAKSMQLNSSDKTLANEMKHIGIISSGLKDR